MRAASMDLARAPIGARRTARIGQRVAEHLPGSFPSRVWTMVEMLVCPLSRTLRAACRVAIACPLVIALMPASDIVGEFLMNVIFASNQILHDDPDTVRRFLKAWYETVDAMRRDKRGTVRAASRTSPPRKVML